MSASVNLDVSSEDELKAYLELAEKNNIKRTLPQKVALLKSCMKMGEDNVKKIENLKSKDLIVVLGNTGCGKSTLINYLAGCNFELKETNGNDVFIVSKNSHQKELMGIGHSCSSETLIPKVALVEGKTYCDCPGFLENRGFEISIANSINIKQIVGSSKSFRIVLLSNWHSLHADRASGFKKTIDIAMSFFGNADSLEKHKNSILFGITHMEIRSVNKKKQLKLTDLKSFIKESSEKYKNEEQKLIDIFTENLFIYDPIDRTDLLKYAGGLNRDQLLKKLDNLTEIKKKDFFKITLTAEDKEELNNTCEQASIDIENILKETELENKYKQVNALLKLIYSLKAVRHDKIDKKVSSCLEKVKNHFVSLNNDLYKKLAKHNIKEARETLKVISDGIEKFDQEYRSEIKSKTNLKTLEDAIISSERKRNWENIKNHALVLAPFVGPIIGHTIGPIIGHTIGPIIQLVQKGINLCIRFFRGCFG